MRSGPCGHYTGISVGWSWGYAESSAHHNAIEFNHVHHVAKGQLSDAGGIYTLGVSPGTVIRNNVFHDVISCPRVSGGWGIYFDEGSTDILAENNLVYNTLTGTLHQHYGRENRVQNNIFAFSHRGPLIRSREEEHSSFFFERNIVYFNNDQLLGSTWKNGNFDLDSNCYWSSVKEDLDFAGRTIEEWRAEGHDEHSLIADPGFVNAEAADFRLQPDSPALKVGFKPFGFSTAGLYGEPEWVNKPKQIPRELFVDHHLIGSLHGARLALHRPQPREIVLKFDQPWEGLYSGYETVLRDGATFRFYYRGMPEAKHDLDTEVTCVAESQDGIHWARPKLRIYEVRGTKDNNVVLARNRGCHNLAPFIDTNPMCPADQRYKALGGTSKPGLLAFVSPDGASLARTFLQPQTHDRCTLAQ